MSAPTVIAADDAIERMSTWMESPPEEIADAVLLASVAWVDEPTDDRRDALIAAVAAWKTERVERVQTATGSMGCACDADAIREELRGSRQIVEVEGQTIAGRLLLARGCRIAFVDAKGRWCGVGANSAEVTA